MRVISLLFAVGMLLLFTGCASWNPFMLSQPSPYRYNYHHNRWELASPKAEMQYNMYNNQWSYVE